MISVRPSLNEIESPGQFEYAIHMHIVCILYRSTLGMSEAACAKHADTQYGMNDACVLQLEIGNAAELSFIETWPSADLV